MDEYIVKIFMTDQLQLIDNYIVNLDFCNINGACHLLPIFFEAGCLVFTNDCAKGAYQQRSFSILTMFMVAER